MKEKIKNFNIAKSNIGIIAALIIVVAIIISVIVTIIRDVNDETDDQTKSYITQAVSDMKTEVNNAIAKKMTVLTTIGSMASSDYSDASSLYEFYTTNEDMLSYMASCAEVSDFISISAVLYDDEITPNGAKRLVYDSENDEIYLYAPIDSGDKNYYITIVGVLSKEVFSEIVSVTTFGQSDNTYVCDASGIVLGGRQTTVENITDLFSSESFIKTFTGTIKSKKSGYLKYYGSHKMYVCFAKLSCGKFYVVTLVSASNIEESVSGITENTQKLMLTVLIAITLMFVYIVYFNYRYLLYKKIVRERLNIYANQSHSLSFDYKAAHNKADYSDNVLDFLGYYPKRELVDKNGNIDVLSKESGEVVKNLLNEPFNEDEPYKSCDINLIDVFGNEVAGYLRFSVIKKNKKVVRVVGTIKIIKQFVKDSRE